MLRHGGPDTQDTSPRTCRQPRETRFTPPGTATTKTFLPNTSSRKSKPPSRWAMRQSSWTTAGRPWIANEDTHSRVIGNPNASPKCGNSSRECTSVECAFYCGTHCHSSASARRCSIAFGASTCATGTARGRMSSIPATLKYGSTSSAHIEQP